MTTIEQIRFQGIEIATKKGLIDLEEKVQIPISNEMIEDFIKILERDLMDFSASECFSNYENLFARAFLYSYGKGAEYAYSHLLNKPLEKIAYDFNECMTGTISKAITNNLRSQLNKKTGIMIEIYESMFQLTKGSQEKIILEGANFDMCVFTILNGGFYWGLRIVLATFTNEDLNSVFKPEVLDKKYDYENYNNNYQESDFRIMNIKY
jgi:hypothetical protein